MLRDQGPTTSDLGPVTSPPQPTYPDSGPAGKWLTMGERAESQAGHRAGEGPDDARDETIAILTEEIRGLRAAAALRALIEQAKGVLVERHHITLDEAFDRLRRMSQEHNVRLVEVAATVVGVSLPPDPLPDGVAPESLLGQLPASPAKSETWRALQGQPEVRSGVLTALIDNAGAATRSADEAAHVLADLLAPQEVAAVTLFRAAADDSLRLVGQYGAPGDLISAWRSIPPSLDIPYVASLQSNTPLFWGTRAARAAAFPNMRIAVRSFSEATAVVPISDRGAAPGVVGLMWASPQDFTPERCAAITATVQRVVPVLLRNAEYNDPESEWLTTVLGLSPDPWLVLETLAGQAAPLAGFRVEAAAPQLVGSADWAGRSLLELWPSLAQDSTGEGLAALAGTGGTWTTTVATASPAPWGSPGTQLRAVRLMRRVALVWRAPR